MVKKVILKIFRKLSHPIIESKVKNILLIGSGDSVFIQPTVKELRRIFPQSAITVYPHSSYIASLKAIPDCNLLEFKGSGLKAKLLFMKDLKNQPNDLVVALWTNEPQYNRFKLLALFLNHKHHMVFNEKTNHFQLSLEHLGLLRLHQEMRQGFYMPMLLMILRLLNYCLLPIGMVILFFRVLWLSIRFKTVGIKR